MKFGVSTFLTDEGLAPTELALALEERGFDSLFVAEHTHIPVNAAAPPDTDLPPQTTTAPWTLLWRWPLPPP